MYWEIYLLLYITYIYSKIHYLYVFLMAINVVKEKQLYIFGVARLELSKLSFVVYDMSHEKKVNFVIAQLDNKCYSDLL